MSGSRKKWTFQIKKVQKSNHSVLHLSYSGCYTDDRFKNEMHAALTAAMTKGAHDAERWKKQCTEYAV